MWRRRIGLGWARDPRSALVRYEIEMALYAAELLSTRSKVADRTPSTADADAEEAIEALLAFPPVRWWR